MGINGGITLHMIIGYTHKAISHQTEMKFQLFIPFSRIVRHLSL
jgi:hypothetical protein